LNAETGSVGRRIAGAVWRRAGFGLCLLWLPLLATASVVDSKKSELDALHQRLQTLQKNYQAAQADKQAVSDSLRQSERAISDASRQLHDTEARLQDAKGSLADVQTAADSTATRIRQQQRRLGGMLLGQYQRGQTDALKSLLNGGDPNQAARDLHYLAALTRAQLGLIESLRADLARLDALHRDASVKAQTLAQIQATRQSQQAKLLADKHARQQVLQKLSSQIVAQGREIATLKRDQARLTELVQRLAQVTMQRRVPKAKPRSAAGRPPRQTPVETVTETPESAPGNSPFARLKGLLHLPVAGELMNRFDARREAGGINWKGLFIRAADGVAVKAIAAGQVVFADWLRGFGNLIIVDHGDGYMSLYSNNESLYKQVGDQVRAGESLAAVGNSGGQRESGLYFEMRYKSRPFNPLSWMK
jgi:septal ring factor EnvC (AmiA/AmiB activator)